MNDEPTDEKNVPKRKILSLEDVLNLSELSDYDAEADAPLSLERTDTNLNWESYKVHMAPGLAHIAQELVSKANEL